MKKIPKQRIDQYLFNNNYFPDLISAQKAIMAGIILVNNEPVFIISTLIKSDSVIVIKKNKFDKFVSRAGYKLEHSINYFNINLKDKICSDIGSSTGGFTDCMLQHGAKKVYAVDVGTNQLAWKLRNDPRVITIEKTNFRYIDINKFNDPIDFVTIDVSFISIKKLIPKLKEIINNKTKIICLIKPQFESQYQEVINGIVNDKTIHLRIINDLIKFFINNNLSVINLTFSPILGAKKGNIEYLIYLKSKLKPTNNIKNIENIINEVWNKFKIS